MFAIHAYEICHGNKWKVSLRYDFYVTDDIPSDAEAEARSQRLDDAECLPLDAGKPESIEHVSKKGMLLYMLARMSMQLQNCLTVLLWCTFLSV